MNASDIRGLTNEELVLAERNSAEELWKLRFQHHTGQLSDTAKIKALRKRVARLRTVASERRLGISTVPRTIGGGE